ncbi:hypothetical protein ES702_03128 [subsurface metagenome]
MRDNSLRVLIYLLMEDVVYKMGMAGMAGMLLPMMGMVWRLS